MNGAKHFPKIVLALAISLAVHLLFWFGPQIHIALNPPQPAPLDATLVKLAPASPAPRIMQPARHVVHKKPAAVPHLTTPDTAPNTAPTALPDDAPPASSGTPTAASAADATSPAPATDSKPPFPLPQQAEIEYLLYKGTTGLNVGTVLQTWNMQDNHYSLTSVAQATGIFSLIKSGKLVQTSQGSLTENGLTPDSFWIQRGQSADSTESAQFNYSGKALTFGSTDNSRTVALPDGTQDLLSFIFQIATAPPASGRFQMYITNGRKLDSYEYQIIGEEPLDLPAGRVRALHLSRIHAQDEDGMDIWLALDQHNLPVKIRFTDRDGGVAEQVASHIQIK